MIAGMSVPTQSVIAFPETNGRMSFSMTHNVLRVGDVALCCPACAGARQYCLHAVISCFILI